MKVIAAILADLEVSPIGTRSRLADSLAGQSVLRRAATRTLQVAGLDSVHVIVPAAQHARAQDLLKALPLQLHPVNWSPAPHQQLIAVTRKWALDNWRGGLGGACAMDESFHAAGLRTLAEAVHAEGVMIVPAHAALLNVDLSQRMLEHFQEHGSQYRMTFAQSPPGLTPVLVTLPLLVDLQQAGYPPGTILAYSPAAPEPDLVGKPICYQVPTTVACTAGRLLADTAEALAMCAAAFESLGEDLVADSLALCKFVTEYRWRHVSPVPAELEIELTTQDAMPNTTLRPRGAAVPDRGRLDMPLLESTLRQLAQRDDALAVFGGFGDPLCHPQWFEAVNFVRKAGIFGLSIHTTGKQLAAVGAEAILAHPPDLLVVRLDAATPAVYKDVHGEEGFSQAVEAVLAVEKGRQQRRQVRPVIVPAMTKALATVRDLEAFVDFWIGHVGSCWVDGYSTGAGQREARQVASMAPPARTMCRRLRGRMLMLADGRAVACDQDFRGVYPIGDLHRQSLAEAWQSEPMQRLRQYLPAQEPSPELLCGRCQEWARP